MEVTRNGRCAIISMKNGENKLSVEFIKCFHQALDAVSSLKDITHLVTTGIGKFYSTGVDLAMVKSSDPKPFLEVLSKLQKLLLRLLTLPLVTVAAINGHCVGGGVMLALAHDCRVMRQERGWFFVPIVRLNYNLPAGLLELLKAKLPQPDLHLVLMTAKCYSAEEGKAAGFIDEVSRANNLLTTAVRIGADSAEEMDLQKLSTMKHSMYRDLCQVLDQPCQFYSNL